MHCLSRRIAHGTLLVVTLLAADASAQPSRAGAPATPPALSASLIGQAKADFDAANLLAENGDFSGALAKFTQAYDASKDVRLLFNMAVCEKNLHHYARMQALLMQYERDSGAALAASERAQLDEALRAIASFVGTIKLVVAEAGAEVSVDGAAAGTSPLGTPLALDLGPHTIAVRKDGFAPVERHFQVAGGNETVVEITLVRTVHPAHLTINAPAAAMVRIDDAPASAGRFDGTLPAGAHAVSVTEPGRRPFAANVELHDGEARSLDVTLESARGTPMWPWLVGGAAVLAGGVVGGYFALKPGDPSVSAPAGSAGGTTFHHRLAK